MRMFVFLIAAIFAMSFSFYSSASGSRGPSIAVASSDKQPDESSSALRQENVAGDEQRLPYPEAQEPQRLTGARPNCLIVGGPALTIGAVNAPREAPANAHIHRPQHSRRND